MNEIQLLSQDTIDKIAAGEVVERPSSVVKELAENAIDAGATAVTVEIKDGGISLIRVTDNGCGIPEEEVRAAFLRHATSKIRTVEDLSAASTLGFRGEALSSIAAVAQVEMITKTPESLLGVRYVIEGGQEQSLEEIGAPEGTTILVRNLFYHTPARRKFLKSAVTEAGYISDLMDRLALSHPSISFKFINNRENRMSTSGNGKERDIIYSLYGRDITSNLIEIEENDGPAAISGYIGKPAISRGNRNYENYFVNGRYVKNAVISRAIEDAYKPFLMSHRFPLTVLTIEVDPGEVDVNVHPTKMEVRFADQSRIYDAVYQTVKEALAHRELIPEVTAAEEKKKKEEKRESERAPEPFEKVRAQSVAEAMQAQSVAESVRAQSEAEAVRAQGVAESSETDILPQLRRSADNGPGALKPVTGVISDRPGEAAADAGLSVAYGKDQTAESAAAAHETAAAGAAGTAKSVPEQMELSEDGRLLSEKNAGRYKIIGQVFETYWIVEFEDKMYIIDQHAAHEKVLYERFMKQLAQKQATSQMVSPPLILSLSMPEEALLNKYMSGFTEVGFEIEPFGGREYAIRAVPGDLLGIADEMLFHEMLDGLNDLGERAGNEAVREKLASMSCKAAVKGNHKLSAAEADALIGELLTLDNPYNCPHGRPTIISMSKYELEKKFKRIV